ncbi:VOC family protein [Horticoccus luteus]|uniref:VOC family protein n=2 Tax=Horticoccus luteus TaxID=2862869 RepID=A0A8F9XKZ8_9BACT|nr:VOC family protein [Horticoccus luteus]QYM80198.1 VOC family protein [Horticoccus luteus]
MTLFLMWIKTRVFVAAIVGVAGFVACSRAGADGPGPQSAAPANVVEQAPAAAKKVDAHQAQDHVEPHATQKQKSPMTRVTGIGGVFIKAKDPVALRAWYQTHLGIDVQTWGGTAFRWVDAAGAPTGGTTAWQIGDGANFAPGTASFMINYRVADLRALLKALREEGCRVLDQVEESDYGRFGWVVDPEGNKVELWEPPAGQ